jgi:hypothetical protein
MPGRSGAGGQGSLAAAMTSRGTDVIGPVFLKGATLSAADNRSWPRLVAYDAPLNMAHDHFGIEHIQLFSDGLPIDPIGNIDDDRGAVIVDRRSDAMADACRSQNFAGHLRGCGYSTLGHFVLAQLGLSPSAFRIGPIGHA